MDVLQLNLADQRKQKPRAAEGVGEKGSEKQTNECIVLLQKDSVTRGTR